jgi:hypothetical protein
MNQFLPSRYVEVIHRLALGIEPIDALRSRRLGHELYVGHDAAHSGKPRPPLERHSSNLYALRYQPGVTGQLDLRFFDSMERFYRPQYDRRRVVPRRLRIPLLSLADVEAAEQLDKKDFKRRIRRPVFFPGAAYAFDGMTTALRGRVVRNGNPVRWARVVARLEGQTVVVGRAHGDDRGEFLLLVNTKDVTGGALPRPFRIEVSVFSPGVVPVPDPPGLPALDPLWDLPLEEIVAGPGVDDPVETGEKLPDDYSANIKPVIEFTLGKCLYQEFEIT